MAILATDAWRPARKGSNHATQIGVVRALVLTFLAALAVSAAIGVAGAANAEAAGSVKISRYDAPGNLMGITTTASVSPSTTGPQTANPATFAQAGGLITISTTNLTGYTERYRFCTALITAVNPFPDCNVGGFTNSSSFQINAGFNDYVKVWFNYVPDTVNPDPPATCSGPTTATVNQPVTFTAGGGNGNYSWSAGPNASPSNQTSGSGTFTTTFSTTGTKDVNVASPSGSAVDNTCHVSVSQPQPTSARCRTISPVNSNANPPPRLNINANESVTVQAEDGTGVYTWSAPGGSPSTGSQKQLTTTYAQGGDYTITVTDSAGRSGAACTVRVTAPVTPAQCSPTTASVAPGQPVTFHATGGNGNYSWSATPDGSPGSSVSGSATFTTTFPTGGTKQVNVASPAATEIDMTCTVYVYTSLALPKVYVSSITGSLFFKAPKDGQENQVDVTGSGGNYTVTDLGSPQITPGSGCQATADPHAVTCHTPTATNRIYLYTYYGDDNANIYNTVTANGRIYGSDGNDHLDGGGGDDAIKGDRGNDHLGGGPGKNRLSGSYDNDTLVSRKDAADYLSPGSGVDHIDGADNDTLDRVYCSSDLADFFRADPGELYVSSYCKLGY